MRLVDAQIAPYAASLAAAGLPTPVYDTAHHARGSVADTVAFLLTLDTVNFGSGYFPHLRKRPGMSGYFTVASSLKERWERDGPLTGAELRAMTAGDCAVLFGQEGNAGPAQELMALFAQALNDLGAWLGGRYDDDPLGPIADAGHSAARLVELVSEMPFYRDVSIYRRTPRSRSTSAPRFWSPTLPSPSTGRARARSTISTVSPSSPTTSCRTCCVSTGSSPTTTNSWRASNAVS